MKIHKYQFPENLDESIFEVDLPVASKILTTQIQNGHVIMWYMVPDNSGFTGMFTHRFKFYTTGFEDVPINARYMNTLQFVSGLFVYHLFEI